MSMHISTDLLEFRKLAKNLGGNIKLSMTMPLYSTNKKTKSWLDMG